MAPPKWRGALNSAFQLFIGVGVVSATVVNYFAAQVGEMGWRIAVSSLIQRGLVQEARQSLSQVRSCDSDTEAELNELISHSQAIKSAGSEPYKAIFQRRYRPHLVLTVAIPSFQQLTGINVVAFYAPVLFRSIGFGSDKALLGAIILGVVNLSSTLVSTFAVDRFGRRFLFLEAGVQMFLCQVSFLTIIIFIYP